MSRPHRIVYLETINLAPHIKMRRPNFPHEWVSYENTEPHKVIERLQDATIAIVNKSKIDGETIKQLPKLQMISMAATGTDPIDLEACNARGILVSNIRGYANNSLPEHTFGLILYLRRQIEGYRREVANGSWSRSGQFCLFTHPIEDLRGKQLGIIGEGELGTAVATIGENGFGMRPVYLNHDGVSDAQKLNKIFLNHNEFMETSDVITIHCALTPNTHHLLNADAFGRMKHSALVINTARGAVIKEQDLITALQEKLIAGAGIDVVDGEPPSEKHPYIALLDQPNFLLTPHVAWTSVEAMQALADQCIENIENFFNGNPSNLVNMN